MNAILKRLYDSAPPVRPLLASGYGLMMRRWRYGPETEDIVSEALARERWGADQWDGYRREKLAELLRDAAANVPYYRDQWRRRRGLGDDSPVELLENWPVLTKETLRTRPREFLREGVNPDQLMEESTSGSTGTPVTTWRSRQTLTTWYGLAEARWRRWYGIGRSDRWGMLGGKIVVPFHQERSPYWVWNAALNQLYMSTFHLKPANTAAYLGALRRYRVTYLYGYASSLHALARDALEQGLEAPAMAVVVSNAEPLLASQRAAIEKAFSCPVRDTYGMSESVAAASECEHGQMHLWPEVGHVEVFADEIDEPVAPGRDGRLICTSWLNRDMPLIRYEVGDRGALAAEAPCSCGRTLPRLERIVGRLSDNLVTADGRRIFQLDHVFYALRVREAQIVQDDLSRVRVRVSPAPGYDERDEQAMTTRIRERLGDVRVEFERVTALERERSGKMRAVICRVKLEQSGGQDAAATA